MEFKSQCSDETLEMNTFIIRNVRIIGFIPLIIEKVLIIQIVRGEIHKMRIVK